VDVKVEAGAALSSAVAGVFSIAGETSAEMGAGAEAGAEADAEAEAEAETGTAVV
jgi:hypothetical protein